jgi:hypothetical protein
MFFFSFFFLEIKYHKQEKISNCFNPQSAQRIEHSDYSLCALRFPAMRYALCYSYLSASIGLAAAALRV